VVSAIKRRSQEASSYNHSITICPANVAVRGRALIRMRVTARAKKIAQHDAEGRSLLRISHLGSNGKMKCCGRHDEWLS